MKVGPEKTLTMHTARQRHILALTFKSPNPVVRPIFADRAGIEAQTVVLDRRPDILVIMFRWGTTWHSVVINFKVRKAAISGVASDTVGVSGSVWTADCK